MNSNIKKHVSKDLIKSKKNKTTQKILSIVICTLILISSTGCTIEKNNFNVGGKSNIKIRKNDVTLSVKEGTLTNKCATFILKNNSNKSFLYGHPYEMEIKDNGEWHKIELIIDFDLKAYTLGSNDTKELEIDWENSYGKLKKGTYRIIKNIYYEDPEGKDATFYLAAEFEIK